MKTSFWEVGQYLCLNLSYGVLHRAELGHQRYHRLLDENIAIPHKCQHQQQCGEDNHLVSCLCSFGAQIPAGIRVCPACTSPADETPNCCKLGLPKLILLPAIAE